MARKALEKISKKVSTPQTTDYLSKIENNINSNQSRLSMVLGALIILVVGILVFNYFSKSKSSLGPAQQAEQNQQQDVTSNQLPGKYTVKEGDTLFLIAEKYYKNGDKFSEIAKANNLSDVNIIVVGQVIEIPKLTEEIAMTSPTPASSPSMEASPTPNAISGIGTGGGNTTIWGEKIEGNTYTVVEGDWLSKIAGRSYGDIMAFEKIAKANNISNPDLIEPGMVLTIPR